MESVGDDDGDQSRSLQSSKSSRSTESVHLNAETRARLRALLESTGACVLYCVKPKCIVYCYQSDCLVRNTAQCSLLSSYL